MANPNLKLAEAFEVISGVVNLRPASFILELAGLPGREAERAHDNGWDKIFFNGGFDEQEQGFSASTTIGRPLHEDALTSLPSEAADRIRASRPADLLARIKECDGHIQYIVCTEGASEEDFWATDMASPDVNVQLDAPQGFTHPTGEIIIKDLHRALADAGAATLARSLSS